METDLLNITMNKKSWITRQEAIHHTLHTKLVVNIILPCRKWDWDCMRCGGWDGSTQDSWATNRGCHALLTPWSDRFGNLAQRWLNSFYLNLICPLHVPVEPAGKTRALMWNCTRLFGQSFRGIFTHGSFCCFGRDQRWAHLIIWFARRMKS